MPIEIKLVLSDEALAALANAINGGGQPPMTPNVEPAPAASAPAKTKAAKPPKAEPVAAEPEPAAEEPEAEATTDLVTQAQIDAVGESANDVALDEVRQSLIDYYQAMGHDKKTAQKAVADMEDTSLRAEYTNFLCRLLVDETGVYPDDYVTPYIATRMDDGVEVKHWVKGGVTLTAEEVTAAGLEDPAAPPKAAKKGPALPKRVAKK